MIKTIIQTITEYRVKNLRKLYYFSIRLGVITKNIQPYERSLIEKLRPICYEGMPASVILLIQRLCVGKCYDRATMLSMGMEKFNLVYGSIRGIRLDSNKTNDKSIIEASDHCWVESGKWVYDTSRCFKVKKWFYYLIERPVIRCRRNQDWYQQQESYKEELNNGVEKK